MNGHLAGELAMFDELYDHLVELVTPLHEEALNWRPPSSDSNSISVLVRHTIGSIGWWCSLALDAPFERDRDAEFRSHDTAPALLEALEASRVSTRTLFERLDEVDADASRVVTRMAPEPVPVTAGWCVAHALRHAGEHWGQIQLTRDLFLAAS